MIRYSDDARINNDPMRRFNIKQNKHSTFIGFRKNKLPFYKRSVCITLYGTDRTRLIMIYFMSVEL